jgi:hypothetical protein
MCAKSPAAYSVAPSPESASARTGASAPGSQSRAFAGGTELAFGSGIAASAAIRSRAGWVDCWPMWSKSPPT